MSRSKKNWISEAVKKPDFLKKTLSVNTNKDTPGAELEKATLTKKRTILGKALRKLKR